MVQICCALHNFLLDKNYPIPDVEPSATPDFDLGDLDDEDLDDTIPLSVSDAGEPENIMVDENPVEEMDKPATHQVLLDIFF